MGDWVPPYYGIETIIKKVDKISKVDEKINELLIEREQYVTELKEAIEKENSRKAQN